MQSSESKPVLDADNLLKGFQQLSELSFSSWKKLFEANTKMWGDAGNVLSSMGVNIGQKKKSNCNCCPPDDDCPSHCLLVIERTAHAGEVIIVPFAVKNTCSTVKSYRVGVRPLMDQNGQQAPSQPTLDKTEIEVQPNQSVMVSMNLNLSQGYQPGGIYQADIVIREKDINQNICFKLKIEPFYDVPEVKPLDEKKYKLHFQSWQSHFYCEPQKATRVAIMQDVENNDANANNIRG